MAKKSIPIPARPVQGSVVANPGDFLGDELDLKAPPGQTTTPGTEVTLITSVVPAGKTRKLTQVIVTCRQSGVWKLYAGATVIASGRNAPGRPDSIFPFSPRKSIAASVTITLKYTASNWAAASDIEAYVFGNDE